MERITGTASSEVLEGTEQAEEIRGAAGNDTLLALGGNDTAVGGLGNDSIDGGSGDDLLQGASGDDTINGGNDNDTIKGGDDNDSLSGNFGNDEIRAGLGNDTINGGSGNDSLFGEAGDDQLSDGISGDDLLRGGLGNDSLFSEGGHDLLLGLSGEDTLSSVVGYLFSPSTREIDTLTGGSGADTFGLIDFRSATTSAVLNSDYALITDYNVGEDSLELEGLPSSISFEIETVSFNGAGTSANDTLIYSVDEFGAGSSRTIDFSTGVPVLVTTPARYLIGVVQDVTLSESQISSENDISFV